MLPTSETRVSPRFEDLWPGRRFTGRPRHLDAAAVAEFAAVTGDRSPLHLEEGHTPDGRPLVHGAFVAAGFFGWLHDTGLAEHVEAALDMSWDFRAPVYTGDSVTYEMTVTRCRRTSSGQTGVVGRYVLVRNQDGRVVCEGRTSALVRTREPGDGGRTGAEFPTVRWARRLAERLDASPAFAEATGTWDGTIGLGFADDVVLFRIYRGRVLDAGGRVPNGPTFVLGATDLTWTELLTGPENDYMARTMRGQFSTSGDAYSSVRMTAAVVAMIDEARELVREAVR